MCDEHFAKYGTNQRLTPDSDRQRHTAFLIRHQRDTIQPPNLYSDKKKRYPVQVSVLHNVNYFSKSEVTK